jgi:predicted amidohydrolase
MKIAAAQYNIAWNNCEANFTRVEKFARQAQELKADMLLLPETFSTGFSLLDATEVKEIGPKSEEFLLQLSKNYPITIAGSFLGMAQSGKPWNHLIVCQGGEVLGRYSKMHLFGYGGETEKYERGARTLTLQLNNIRFSFFICYDLRFPKPWAQVAKDTDVYVVVANWPRARIAHWKTLIAARAIENQAYVVGVNRVGIGGSLDYNGQSVCIAPRGEIVADASESESLMLADINLEYVNTYRTEFPCLADRLPGIDE